MPNAAVIADIFGTLGAVCWSIQLTPQIYTNYTTKSTLGLQPTMMLLWATAGLPLGIYNITRSFPIALQIQPQILTFLSLITWAQTKYYPPARDKKVRSVKWCISVLCGICLVFGAIEVAVILGLRVAIRGKTAHEIEYYPPVMLMGILAAILLCAGVGRHYIDIYQERTVRGISFLFVGIDALGDLTSLISVVFWWRAGRGLDVLGCVIYAAELVMWCGVFGCAAVLNLPGWIRRKRKGRGVGADTGVGVNDGMDSARNQDEHLGRQIERVHRGRSESESGSVNERGSTNSRKSQISGTCFRTASGRTLNRTGEEIALDDMRHDALRLRNVIQIRS